MPPLTEEFLNKLIFELTQVREQNAALQVKLLGELGELRNEITQLKKTVTDHHNIILELLKQGQIQSTITPPSHTDHNCTQNKQITPNTSKDGEWNCSQCHFKNTPSQIICICRQSTKPDSDHFQNKSSNFAKHVFHDTILHGLHLSPGAFHHHDTPSNDATPISFRWSIEHQSFFNPANIDESRVHEQNSSLFEMADNHKIQKAVSSYFKKCNFPSPIHPLHTPQTPQTPQTRPRYGFLSPAILRDQPMESSP